MEQAQRANDYILGRKPDDPQRQRPLTDGNASAPASEALLLAWRAAQLTSALNVVSDAVIVCDSSGHILDANPAARALFTLRGRSEGTGQARYAELASLTLRDRHGLALPDQRAPLTRILRGEVLEGENAAEVIAYAQDGRALVLIATGMPLRDEHGHIIGAMLAFHDVTAQRQTERQVREALEALLATAHTLVVYGGQPQERDGTLLPGRAQRSTGEVAQRMHDAINRASEAGAGHAADWENHARAFPAPQLSHEAGLVRGAGYHGRAAELAVRAYAEAAARSVRAMGPAAWRRSALPAAQVALERALAVVGDSICPERVQALIHLADLRTFHLGQPGEAIPCARQAREVAHALNDPLLEAAANRALAASTFAHHHDLPGGLRLLETALAALGGGGDPVRSAQYRLALAGMRYWAADLSEAEALARRAVDIAEPRLPTQELHGAHCVLALVLASRGDWEGAGQALSASPSSSHAYLPGCVISGLLPYVPAFLAYQGEDYRQAAHELRAAAAHAHNALEGFALSTGLQGLIQIEREAPEAARSTFDELEALLPRFEANALIRVPVLVCLGLMAAALAPRERAAALYGQLLAFRGHHALFLVDRVLGLLATQLQQWNAAATHLEDAEALARRACATPELGRTLLARADLEAGRGGPDSLARERDTLTEARALFDALGLRLAVEQTDKRLRRLAHAPDEPDHSRAPAGLTRREVDVMRLIADGRSNREIARELGITEKTVAHHLNSICNKTRSPNRAAVAAFAVRHGLA